MASTPVEPVAPVAVHGCPNCKKTFPDAVRQAQHIASAHSTKELPCPSCNKQFASESALRQHSRVHNLGNPSPQPTSSAPETPDLVDTSFTPTKAHTPAKAAALTKKAHPSLKKTPSPAQNPSPAPSASPKKSATPAKQNHKHNEGHGKKTIVIPIQRPAEVATELTESVAMSFDPSQSHPTPIKRSFDGGRGHHGQHTPTQGTEPNRPSSASKVLNRIMTPANAPQRQAFSRGATPVQFSGSRSVSRQGGGGGGGGGGRPDSRGRMGRKIIYPHYWTEARARQAIADGKAWEGVLRANPNASRMCFFTIPGRTKDLMVKDEWLNRAFPGDTVIIMMLDEHDLKEEEAFQERRSNRRTGSGRSSTASSKAPSTASTPAPFGAQSSSDSSSASSSSPSPAPTQELKLNSEDLKGLHDHSEDEDSHSDADHHSLGSVEEEENSDNDSDSENAKVLSVEEQAKLAEQDLSLLNLSVHANFHASDFHGLLEEDKPKSELAKVVYISNPYHKQLGYVGRLQRTQDGKFELRPVAVQHPIFDVPAPDPEFWESIPMAEAKTGANGARKRKKKPSKPQTTQLFITHFDCWNDFCRRPLGTKPELVGDAGNIEAECKAITSTHMIDTTPHPARLSASFGTGTTITIDEKELARRKDLRTTRIFTVDPPTARDIDDALSIEKISEDRYRVGVHIADVSHYVTPGSELDKIAQKRSTSVYMVNTMYPMLPGALSENLCSLNPKVDRFAFSVIWELDAQGNEITQWIGRTIIRSCVKLSYLDAQKCIDAEEAGNMQPAWDHLSSLQPEQDPKDIAQDILNLNMIAQRMRDRRFATGALRLSRLKLHFELGPDGLPVDAHPYYIKESNQLIEEFMLLANMTVAKFIYKSAPHSALLRSHPSPKEDILESFGHLMKALRIPFDSSTSGDLYRSLLSLEEWQHRPIEELVTKAMNAAIYISTGTIAQEEELWHYALNVPFYTHFTSPIRRYPDIIVHRQIQYALDKRDGKLYGTIEELINADPCHDSNWVATMADTSNERKRAARKAQDDSIKLFTCLFLKKGPYVDNESLVLEVSKTKITVFSPHLCLRIRLDIPEKKGYINKFDANTRVLSIADATSNKTLVSVTYFSKISITYYTRGNLPMEVAGDLTLWYKPEAPAAPATPAKIPGSTPATPAAK